MQLWQRVRTKASERLFRGLVRARSDVPVVRVGNTYGGFWVPQGVLDEDSTCYSAGLGEDASFDLGLIERFGSEVHALDPTPRSIAFAEGIENPRFHFHPLGLWSTATTLRFYAPKDPAHVSHSALNVQETEDYFEAECDSLAGVMDRLGHGRVDLLKMNIEGAEGEVIDTLLKGSATPRVLIVAFEEPTLRDRLRRVRQLRDFGYEPVRAHGHAVTFLRRESPSVR